MGFGGWVDGREKFMFVDRERMLVAFDFFEAVL